MTTRCNCHCRLWTAWLASFMFSAGVLFYRSEAPVYADNNNSVIKADVKPNTVEVDAATVNDVPGIDLYAVCKLAKPEANAPALWEPTMNMTGVGVKSDSDCTELPVYSVRSQTGVNVLLVNHGASKTQFILNVKLSRGVYSVERYCFSLKTPETLPRLDRLEGVILEATGAIEKPGWLNSDTAAIYRYTNRSLQVQTTYKNAKTLCSPLKSNHSAQYNKLNAPLTECGSQIAALNNGITKSRCNDALKHIHRAILTVSAVQAICRNYNDNHVWDEVDGNAFEESLHDLEASLTELSTACLGLVPALEMETPNPDSPMNKTVTISLTNTGRMAVSLVKLGASVPGGVSVTPTDQAFFSVIKPGETVRASFKLILRDPSDAREVVANIGYFMARTPATIHIKAL